MTAAVENVVIQAGNCFLTVLPALGGKISSLRVGEHELLQAPLKPLAARTHTMGFDDADASGWDECLPSVSACVVETEAGPIEVPDHGDLWRVAWEVVEATGDSNTMRAMCFSMPLELTRSMILRQIGSGWRLSLMYTLANLGSRPLPWAWSAHPLFVCDESDRIVLPPSIQKVRVQGSGGGRLTEKTRECDAVGWPVATLADGSKDDLSLTKAANSGAGDKLFAGPMIDASDGWSSLERPGLALRITVRVDVEKTPYLGLWLCYGGWPDGSGPKQVCVALEPTTAPADSLAEALSGAFPQSEVRFPALGPGETFSWPMDIEIDPLNSIAAIDQVDRMTEFTEAH